jgi:hypothetical protein
MGEKGLDILERAASVHELSVQAAYRLGRRSNNRAYESRQA